MILLDLLDLLFIYFFYTRCLILLSEHFNLVVFYLFHFSSLSLLLVPFLLSNSLFMLRCSSFLPFFFSNKKILRNFLVGFMVLSNIAMIITPTFISQAQISFFEIQICMCNYVFNSSSWVYVFSTDINSTATKWSSWLCSSKPASLKGYSISFDINFILLGAQSQILEIIFEFSFSHTPHPIYQQIHLLLKHKQNQISDVGASIMQCLHYCHSLLSHHHHSILHLILPSVFKRAIIVKCVFLKNNFTLDSGGHIYRFVPWHGRTVWGWGLGYIHTPR